jgi:NhaP-type Na+/H+ or K+/H+ antiporter
MLASTDALAITSILRRAGGPESLVTLMEGESLLNDASGIVLFEIFQGMAASLPGEGEGEGPSPLAVLPLMARQITQASLGGATCCRYPSPCAPCHVWD